MPRNIPTDGGANRVDQNGQRAQSNIRTLTLQKADLKHLKSKSNEENPSSEAVWERLRSELRLDEEEKRVAILAWASSKGKKCSGILVSFYDNLLSQRTGQLVFRAQLDKFDSLDSVSLTYYPNSTCTLRERFKYFPRGSRKKGYPPNEYSAKELIANYARAFIGQSNQNQQWKIARLLKSLKWNKKQGNRGPPTDEEELVNQFFKLLGLKTNRNRKSQAKVRIKNVIETDSEETNVHLFIYKRRLDFLRGGNAISNKFGTKEPLMHWGVIFKFEKPTGDVYWTLDGEHSGKSFVVTAHRCPPKDIEIEIDENNNVIKPFVTYFGFVRSSRRNVILVAKELKSTERFGGIYRILARNCQEWTVELLKKLIETHDRFWWGPKTLDGKYFNECGLKKSPPLCELDNKITEVPNNRLLKCVNVKLISGDNNQEITALNSVETYEELLSAIIDHYGMQEEDFKETRNTRVVKLLRKLSDQDPFLLVKFSKLGEETVEVSYTIRAHLGGFSISRYLGDPGDRLGIDGKSDAVLACFSIQGLFKWCAMIQQWLLTRDDSTKHIYSHESFSKELIESLQLISLPATVKQVLREKLKEFCSCIIEKMGNNCLVL